MDKHEETARRILKQGNCKGINCHECNWITGNDPITFRCTASGLKEIEQWLLDNKEKTVMDTELKEVDNHIYKEWNNKKYREVCGFEEANDFVGNVITMNLTKYLITNYTTENEGVITFMCGIHQISARMAVKHATLADGQPVGVEVKDEKPDFLLPLLDEKMLMSVLDLGIDEQSARIRYYIKNKGWNSDGNTYFICRNIKSGVFSFWESGKIEHNYYSITVDTLEHAKYLVDNLNRLYN